jgi:hypothetical protein
MTSNLLTSCIVSSIIWFTCGSISCITNLITEQAVSLRLLMLCRRISTVEMRFMGLRKSTGANLLRERELRLNLSIRIYF